MTGEEYAMELVRQCWTNRPLSQAEYFALRQVAFHCQRTPALLKLCWDLADSSQTLSFLFAKTGQLERAVGNDFDIADAKTEYSYLNDEGRNNNVRSLLTDAEEKRILGRHRNHCVPTQKYSCRNLYSKRSENFIKVDKDRKSGAYYTLSAHLDGMIESRLPKERLPTFPFAATDTASAMSHHMYADLEASWEAYHSLPTPRLASHVNDTSSAAQAFQALREAVAEERGRIQRFIFDNINWLPLIRVEGTSDQDHMDARLAQVVLQHFQLWKLSWTDSATRLRKALMAAGEKCSEAQVKRIKAKVLSAPNSYSCHARESQMSALISTSNELKDESIYLSLRLKMLRVANRAPQLRLLDLLFCSEELCIALNPVMSETRSHEVQHAFLEWQLLCVLEDKCLRLVHCLRQPNSWKPTALQELQSNRQWKLLEHKEWLAFEVEQQLQIRPQQSAVAELLIANPGSIAQLNMGEGKTRVIIPMILLHWSKVKMCRLTFLSPLIQEAYEFLHQHMCASFHLTRFYQLPFNRDIELDEQKVTLMLRVLNQCRLSGGVIVLAPEHRMSLRLKWFDLKCTQTQQILCHDSLSVVFRILVQHDSAALKAAATTCSHWYSVWCDVIPVNCPDQTHMSALGRRARVCRTILNINRLPVIDILDESDEILRHKSQLVYAMGEHFALPSATCRCCCIQSLLWAISSNTGLRGTLCTTPKCAELPERTDYPNGQFNFIRLLDNEAWENIRAQFCKELVSVVIDAPPYELRWLSKLNDSRHTLLRSEMIDYVVDSSIGKPQSCTIDISQSQMETVLCLRGLLAFGLLEHCLIKRHRVDYGVSRPGKKRLAIPFTAADAPNVRSEFSHPDCALCFTALAYYKDGLSVQEIRTTMNILQKRGKSEQNSVYNEWFSASKSTDLCLKQASIDTFDKIDLSNAIQMDFVCSFYARNMLVINFWLSNDLVPNETHQYPQSIMANAWHVAHNELDDTIGFSGTNDNAVLFPLSVQERVVNTQQGRSTNGKMASIILKNEQYFCISEFAAQHEPHWKTVLRVVAEGLKHFGKRPHALIDAGAILAGVSNDGVVQFLLGSHSTDINAVIYFETKNNRWEVQDKHRQIWSLINAPISEKDPGSFVFFDERHCRGADMKLPPDAVGLLTIGPCMAKSKVMQAAGRMRQLHMAQRVIFIGPEDVSGNISRSEVERHDRVNSKHLLRWVMKNTVAAAEDGLPEWADQGEYFCSTLPSAFNYPHSALVDDDASLMNMYSRPSKLRQVSQTFGGVLSSQEHAHPFLRGIFQHTQAFGQDVMHIQGEHLGQECERELEKEVEQEAEQEKELDHQDPREEVSWQIMCVLLADSVKQVISAQGIDKSRVANIESIDVKLQRILNTSGDHVDLNSIVWPSNLYCTENFVNCLKRVNACCNEYLRLVDTFVTFPNGDVLLLSEYEADTLIEHMWASKADTSYNTATLQHLAFAATAKDGSAALELGRGSTNCSPKQLAALELFAGHVDFVDSGAVRRMLPSSDSKLAASHIPSLRGLHFMFSRSALDDICYETLVSND
jgi:hypothetical protein